ncbi:MAG: ABC transporter substrate-binding protein [Mobilicoccus sp.]|nr:ABC transporter substrate-binding protein [Mobilicoccus sp.]
MTLTTAALVLAACGSQDSPTSDSAASPTDAAAASEGGYPVEVPNCGRTVTLEAAPERIVSLNQGTTEMLLTLGVEERMVGTATWTDPVLPQLADANDEVPRLAENNPSLETVLARQPDLVTASFSGTLSPGGVAPYERFEQLSVPTYLSHVECQKAEPGDGTSDGTRTEALTLDDIAQDIRDLAALTDTRAQGEHLIGDLESRMAAIEPVEGTEPTTVVFWFANAESPYVAGGLGAPELIADRVGLTNVYADRSEEWPQVGWEDIAAKNPDIIVLGDLTRRSQTAETAEAKIDFLESNPVTAQMDAVRNKRYISLPGGDMNPSIRTVDGTEKVAEGVRELGS